MSNAFKAARFLAPDPVTGVISPELEDITIDGVELEGNLTPETLTLEARAEAAGHGMHWTWTWPETLLYDRGSLNDELQDDIPIYRGSSYTFVNYAYTQYGDMTQPHSGFLKSIQGAGTENLVPGITTTIESRYNTTTQTNTDCQVTTWNIPKDFSASDITLVQPTVSWDVDSSTGAYVFNITGETHETSQPEIYAMYRGSTYTFNLSTTGHPFYLTTDNGTNFSSGQYVGEYTNGVTGSRNESGQLVFTVPADAPDTLYYQCGVHGAMQGTINILDLQVEELNDDRNSIRIYFQHSQDGHSNSILVKDAPAVPVSACMMWDGSKWAPTHMNTYIEGNESVQTKIVAVAQDGISVNYNDVVGTPTLANVATTGNFSSLSNAPTIPTDISELTDTTNVLAAASSSTKLVSLLQEGPLEVTTGTTRWYAPDSISISKIVARVDTPSTGSGINITINKTTGGGTTTTTNMTIAAGSKKSTNTSTITMAEDDYLTVDVTQIGSGDPGESLKVTFTYA